MQPVLLICLAALAAVAAAGAAEFSEKELVAARKLYNAKCAKCHKFYHPADYTDAEWRKWMLKMSRKSKLQPAETELLSRYLDTFRAQQGTNMPAGPGKSRGQHDREPTTAQPQDANPAAGDGTSRHPPKQRSRRTPARNLSILP